MPIESVNDFVVRFANVNGSGSASANELFARAVLRMGIPVAPRNIFPSNIQGLPTWYEVRDLGSRPSRRPRRHRPHGRHEPADLGPGRQGHRARRVSALRFDQADAEVEIPRRHHRHRRAAHRHLQSRIHRPAPAPIVQEHHLCRSALRAHRHGRSGNREAHRRAVQGQGEAVRRQQARAASRPRLGDDEPRLPDRAAAKARQRGRRAHLHRRQFRRRARRRLRRRDGLRLVSDHAVVLARRGVHRPLQPPARRCADQEEEVRHHPGRGRAGLDRHRHRRRLERRPRFHGDLRPGNFADAGIPRPCLFRRDSCRDLRRAAGRSFDRHADAHAADRHPLLRLRLPRRHQARAAVPRRPGGGVRIRSARHSISPTGCRRRYS